MDAPVSIIASATGGRHYHASMNLDVLLGSAHETGRMRSYKMGGPADVDEAWSMYHYYSLLL